MACTSNAAVDIGDWVLYGRGEEEGMPFMVGPIVGAVTEEGARCGRLSMQYCTEPSQAVENKDFPVCDIMGAPLSGMRRYIQP